MKIAVTADLHFGLSPKGDAGTREMAARLVADPPDALVLAGDSAAGSRIAFCLRLFEQVPCARLFTAGNHDLWVTEEGGDSLEIFSIELEKAGRETGFHYLDSGPWTAPDRSVSVVGSVNWYDYSLSFDRIFAIRRDAGAMLSRKLFLSGVHNDGRFVRLGMSDGEFTGMIVSRLESHLAKAAARSEAVVLATHIPVFPEMLKQDLGTSDLDELLWIAYSGNRKAAEIVLAQPKVRWAFCGHTHSFKRAAVGRIDAVNVGSSYEVKRLALLDTASGAVSFESFPADSKPSGGR